MTRYQAFIYKEIKYVRYMLEDYDEFAINFAAYHSQQVVEKICGYICQQLGIKSIRSHNILQWIKHLQSFNVKIPDLIVEKAEEITEWEETTRYNINFQESRRDINQVLDVCEKWLEEVDKIKIKRGIEIEKNVNGNNLFKKNND